MKILIMILIVSMCLVVRKEVIIVASKQGIMSETLKQGIAKDLGVYDTVRTAGWGAVSSRDCGNLVKKAIEMAEKNMINRW